MSDVASLPFDVLSRRGLSFTVGLYCAICSFAIVDIMLDWARHIEYQD